MGPLANFTLVLVSLVFWCLLIFYLACLIFMYYLIWWIIVLFLGFSIFYLVVMYAFLSIFQELSSLNYLSHQGRYDGRTCLILVFSYETWEVDMLSFFFFFCINQTIQFSWVSLRYKSLINPLFFCLLLPDILLKL